MKTKMTINELNHLIIDNFSDENEDIDISGLKFDCNVSISNMEINGDLNQSSHKVDGNLYQDNIEEK